MQKITKYGLLFSLSTLLCVGCSTKAPIPCPEDPITEDRVLKEANVRDVTVLWTDASVGGAAERQQEWADYLYDEHFVGEAPIPSIKDDKEKLAPVAVEEKKDQSIYSKDRSIYSKDRSIYANQKAKKKVAKKKVAVVPKKATKKSVTKKVTKPVVAKKVEKKVEKKPAAQPVKKPQSPTPSKSDMKKKSLVIQKTSPVVPVQKKEVAPAKPVTPVAKTMEEKVATPVVTEKKASPLTPAKAEATKAVTTPNTPPVTPPKAATEEKKHVVATPPVTVKTEVKETVKAVEKKVEGKKVEATKAVEKKATEVKEAVKTVAQEATPAKAEVKKTETATPQDPTKPRIMARPRTVKGPSFKTVKTNNVDGQKVDSKTIVELKDVPQKK